MPTITPTNEPCGAVVTDIDVSEPLDAQAAAALRSALDEHHVLVFPDQTLTTASLERFATTFGSLGADPWFEPIDGSDHVAEIRRDASETTRLFGEGWHSDWSFLATPPIATCLYGIVIPPVGGDTLFANQHLALELMPQELTDRIHQLRAVHTTRGVYGKGGMHDPDNEGEQGRTMKIVADQDPFDFIHPLVRVHEGNGRPAVFSALGYIQDIVGMDHEDARELLREVFAYQTAEQVIYRHAWEPNMCVVWDNRSVLHRATGGYEGHARLLRRVTVFPA